MNIIYKKYLKQLVDFGISIMIVGAKESGKTSMIKQYITLNYNGQIVIKGANMLSAITEINSKLVLF
jgi:GTPase SAR1 family protein